LSLRVLRPQFRRRLYVFGVDNVGEELKVASGFSRASSRNSRLNWAKRFAGNQVVFLARAPCLVARHGGCSRIVREVGVDGKSTS
jgi:hypothetical protein